jgi:hypothetical protein
VHASCYANLSCDSNISWRVNIMNFLLWDFLSFLVTSSRSSPAFFLSTFVSITVSLCTFTGLGSVFTTFQKKRQCFIPNGWILLSSLWLRFHRVKIFMHCSLNIYMFYFIPPPQLFRTPHWICILFSACISWCIFLVHIDLHEL